MSDSTPTYEQLARCAGDWRKRLSMASDGVCAMEALAKALCAGIRVGLRCDKDGWTVIVDDTWHKKKCSLAHLILWALRPRRLELRCDDASQATYMSNEQAANVLEDGFSSDSKLRFVLVDDYGTEEPVDRL